MNEALSTISDGTAKSGESAAPVYDASNGFGLFDPATPVKKFELPQLPPDFNIADIYAPDLDRVQAFYDAFDAVFHEHRDYEYAPTNRDSPAGVQLLSEGRELATIKTAFLYWSSLTLDDDPLADLWRKTMADFGADAAFIYSLATMHRFEFDELPDTDGLVACAEAVYEITKKAKYGEKTRGLIVAMVKEFPHGEKFSLARAMAHRFFQLAEMETQTPDDAETFMARMMFWLSDMKAYADGDESFKEYFELAWEWSNSKIARAEGWSQLSVVDLARALALGLIDEDDAIRHILTVPQDDPIIHDIQPVIRELTSYASARQADAFYPGMERVREKICSRLVEIELRRGDRPTDTSAMATNLGGFFGARHFVDILSHGDVEPYERHMQRESEHTGDSGPRRPWTKKTMLGHLLMACYPAKGEDEKSLRALLADKKISEKRLIEGAMDAPQWIGIVGKYLSWEGFESACWFFHAHVNEYYFWSDKQTKVARHSEIAPPDFKDGAFDIAWFEEVRSVLGPKRFALACEAAEFISVGISHRRLQLFIDAAAGRLKLSDVERGITEKRAEDYILCYGLVPLDKRNKTKDAQHRYEVLRQFLRESGPSEARAVQVATENLARNAGYASVLRFVLAVEDDGREVYVALPDQHARACAELERAMVSGEEFEPGELTKLSEHPIVGPLLENLVFKTGDDIGYLSALPLKKNSGVVVAHPLDLHESGRWQEFRRDLFERKIVQPFRQVFRELYLPSDDELTDGATVSERYAGHRAQEWQGARLLKTRGWTRCHDEELQGIQHVYHRENLIAVTGGPDAGVEPPLLETVRFFTCRDHQSVALTDVPKKIFSEVMRDVDLVASVAYDGGDEPEASRSTLEMRRAIAAETVHLLRLDNVIFRGSHAIVTGARGEYSIHLGSAIVHKMAGGALNVPTVPSQHQREIFLPFLDEDSRTAEVVSKILLFAEDGKIKDPVN